MGTKKRELIPTKGKTENKQHTTGGEEETDDTTGWSRAGGTEQTDRRVNKVTELNTKLTND